jgi:REP element-mobilizing transposase RayT
MPYWQLYYHLIWATKERRPLITPDLEPKLHQYLRGKGLDNGGVVHAIGGVEEHVHVVVSIPPRLSVATYVGQLKGASSHWINHFYKHSAHFQWQEGYGAMSFGQKALPRVVEYVLNQRERHSEKRIIQALERVEIENVGP